MTRKTGNWKRGGVEVRYADFEYPTKTVEELDDLVAKNAVVHLEKQDHGSFYLIVETKRERVCLTIGAKNPNAVVTAVETWRDKVARRKR